MIAWIMKNNHVITFLKSYIFTEKAVQKTAHQSKSILSPHRPHL